MHLPSRHSNLDTWSREMPVCMPQWASFHAPVWKHRHQRDQEHCISNFTACNRHIFKSYPFWNESAQCLQDEFTCCKRQVIVSTISNTLVARWCLSLNWKLGALMAWSTYKVDSGSSYNEHLHPCQPQHHPLHPRNTIYPKIPLMFALPLCCETMK